jgi:hypothetical protein
MVSVVMPVDWSVVLVVVSGFWTIALFYVFLIAIITRESCCHEFDIVFARAVVIASSSFVISISAISAVSVVVTASPIAMPMW